MARQDQPFDAVQFTRESSERIAHVVRDYETARPSSAPLSFEAFFEGRRARSRQVRAATFAGAWPIGSVNTVTFKNSPTATAYAQNLSWPITSTSYTSEDCLVGLDAGTWYLIVPRLESRTATVVTQTAQKTYLASSANVTLLKAVGAQTAAVNYVSDVSATASLNTSNCLITVGVTKTVATAVVVSAVTFSTATASVITSTATAAFVSSQSTVTYLRIRVP